MMMVRKSKGLGERHHKILDLLQKYGEKEGYPPSIREIGEQTGITSTSVVNYYLEQLEKWGYIERDRRISRGLRVVPEKLAELGNALASPVLAAAETVNNFLHIPVVGRIGASLPVPVPASDFNYYDAETGVDIARSLLPAKKVDGLFALEVAGDSMIDAMVNDGDIVIMRKVDNNSDAKNGDMVAVWLPERDETTLKYFYKEKDGYRLQPANPTMQPIMINKGERLEIKGKVVMVIRKIGGIAM
ncbi:MAG: transcriptional repressor LexA [Chloroflexi bacterium]|nr:transcriptional repressor LexA [Chloroflexota bacterium]